MSYYGHDHMIDYAVYIELGLRGPIVILSWLACFLNVLFFVLYCRGFISVFMIDGVKVQLRPFDTVL